MFYVYVIYSQAHQRYYKGYTTDLVSRLNQHNHGQNKSTRPYRPWVLAYYESFKSQKEALVREKYLKSAAGRRFLKKTLGSNPPD